VLTRVTGCLIVGALLVLSACWGGGNDESEASRLFRTAVWSPGDGTLGPAGAAAEERLAADGARADPDDVFVAAAAALLRGDLDRAEPHLQRLRRTQPERPGFILLAGYRWSLIHDRERAIETFSASIHALAAHPDGEPFRTEVDFLAHLFRGQERYVGRRYFDSTKDLEHARAAFARHGTGVHRELVQFLADCHMHATHIGPAEELLLEAVAEDPDHSSHHFQLGMVRSLQHRTEDAAASYRRCLELDTEAIPPRLKLAEIARIDADLQEMRRQLDALGSRLQPGELNGELIAAEGLYAFERGQELLGQGDDGGADEQFAKARRLFLRALEQNPLCTRVYGFLLQIAELTEAPEEEIRHYRDKIEEMKVYRSGVPATFDPNRTFC
jgi:tetratricopeptide (TPR) repeat protein